MRRFRYVGGASIAEWGERLVVAVEVPWDEGTGLVPPPIIHFGPWPFVYAGVEGEREASEGESAEVET